MEEKQKNFKICEFCKSQATVLCLECIYNNYFCDSCYKIAHNNKENNKHKKEKIDYYLPIDTRCPEHPKVELNLFCIDEKGNIYLIYNLIINRIKLFNVLFFKCP